MTTADFAASPALVTGASRGFGRAIAASLSKAGAPSPAWPAIRPGCRSFAPSWAAPSPR